MLITTEARKTMDLLGFTPARLAELQFLLQLRVAEALTTGRPLSSLAAVVSQLDGEVRVVPRAELLADWRRDDLKPLANRLLELEVPAGAIAVVLDADDVAILVIDMHLDDCPRPRALTGLRDLPASMLTHVAL